MSMNVPNWDNAGVSPSDEKKQKGYAAGECLPAQHLNWFINQTFNNLEAAKPYIDKLETTPPIRIIMGSYVGTGESSEQTIDLGGKPDAVFVIKKADWGDHSTNGYNFLCACIKDGEIWGYGEIVSNDDNQKILLKIVDNGFYVGKRGNFSGSSTLNVSSKTYYYIALFSL